MASGATLSNASSRLEVNSSELTNLSMFQGLLEHGCMDLSSDIDPAGYETYPSAKGGSGDVYKGKMLDGCDVAVKVWRVDVGQPANIKLQMKRAMREIYNWSTLKHDNIHEMLGVTQYLGTVGMVSPWMAAGDLQAFIQKFPGIDRNPWCLQVATGVTYLHQNSTIHGDLKASNILISSAFVAQLSDFDCSLVSGRSMTFSATKELRNSLRWTAPELLEDPDDGAPPLRKTKESDIYSLAMTILEIKTGHLPYKERGSDSSVIGALLKALPPKRPAELGKPLDDQDGIWNLLLECWNHDPVARPKAAQVLARLRGLLH